jgi:hypothetical protein
MATRKKETTETSASTTTSTQEHVLKVEKPVRKLVAGKLLGNRIEDDAIGEVMNETTYIILWQQSSRWFNVPCNLHDKTIALQLVRASGGDQGKFILMPAETNLSELEDVGVRTFAAAYRLYSQPVNVFPLLPYGESNSLGFLIGMEQDGKPHAMNLYEDIRIASEIATKTGEPVSGRIITSMREDGFTEGERRFAGGDSRVEDVYPPTEADAGRVKSNPAKMEFINKMDANGFYDFLLGTGRLVEKLDRTNLWVERLVNAKSSKYQ